MNTVATTTAPSPLSSLSFSRLEPWGFLVVALAMMAGVFQHYYAAMDGYEVGIMLCVFPAILWGGYKWRGLGRLIMAVALFALWGKSLYAGVPEAANTRFMLKYFLASQSAIAWMSTLAFIATVCYWAGLLISKGANDSAKPLFVLQCATALTWTSVFFGITGLLVRWVESYMLGPDVGHIPVSNLYEVSLLFCLMTMIMLLYYEGRTGLRTIGAFVMIIVLADIGFTLWYAVSRQAFAIQPLIPALQSWWMKIHVPANFVGYGAFSAAAMLGVPHLLSSLPRVGPYMPNPKKLEEIMYRLIALGFVGFTIATILGALWAAEAWGAYWQWDPKETWALIVWLNYAAWLHIRHLHKISTKWLSWWAIIGLLITAFAFYGVNMFLSGLHSYGSL